MKIDPPLGVSQRNVAVSVIGTGNMGPGIAATFVAAGHDVRLIGRTPERLEEAVASAAESLSVLGVDPALADRIRLITSLEEGATGAAIVIEAVAEDADIKRDVLERVDRCVSSTTIIASTTSALLLASIADRVSAPDRAVILHYFYPPALIPVVEVVRGDFTSDATVEAVKSLLRGTGKQPVLVTKPVPGFIGNRLLHALMSEAIALVRTGVASAEDIDVVVRGAFTLRLVNAGPLESADLVGLDLIRTIHEEVVPSLEHLRVPDPYLEELVRNGHLGAKTGRGFFDWSGRDAGARRREVQEGVRRVMDAVANVKPST